MDVAARGINFKDPLPHPLAPYIRNAQDCARLHCALGISGTTPSANTLPSQFGQIAQAHLNILRVRVTKIDQ